jgi:hypothetical protein
MELSQSDRVQFRIFVPVTELIQIPVVPAVPMPSIVFPLQSSVTEFAVILKQVLSEESEIEAFNT